MEKEKIKPYKKNAKKHPDMSAEKTAKKSVPGKPFTKGDPRINKEGRPKGAGISITTEIKRKLEEKPEGQDKATYLQLLIKRILKKAVIDGDTTTIKQIWNYIDGMPKQAIEHSGQININRLLDEINREKQKETGEQEMED